MKSGRWVKISTSGKRIYKIPYSQLSEWGFSNPNQVNVFGSGGTIISENPANITYDDLNQNTVWHGKNGSEDCLFFYASGTVEWDLNGSGEFFERKFNDYTTQGFYFLSEEIGDSKIVDMLPEFTDDFTHEIAFYDSYELFEDDLENVLPDGSGKNWYGEKYKNGTIKNTIFDLKNIENSSSVSVRVGAISRSSKSSEMTILANQIEVGKLNFSKVNTGSQTATFADNEEERFFTEIQSDQLTVTTKYFGDNIDGSVDDNAIAWLDFIEINYRKQIKADEECIFFRDVFQLWLSLSVYLQYH